MSWVNISSTNSFSADISWILSSVGGLTKTVAVQYRDAAGNESPTYTETITIQSYTIGVHKFSDKNDNGLQDAGEPDLSVFSLNYQNGIVINGMK